MARSSNHLQKPKQQSSCKDFEKSHQKLRVNLPPVRDNNVEIRVTDPGLLDRTSYTNSTIALDHIKKVR